MENVLTDYDNYIFDCDGVIYYGDRVLTHSREFIQTLYSLGKRLYFLSNSADKD